MQLDSSAAVAIFGLMYARAAPIQASLALCWVPWLPLWLGGAPAGGSGCLAPSSWRSPFPVIKPTNDRLMDAALDSSSDEANGLVVRWSRLHAVRSVAALLSFLVFVVALVRI